MISGSRYLGQCEGHTGGASMCAAAMNHYYDMWAAFRVHVEPVVPAELWHGHAKGADTMALGAWGKLGYGPAHGIPARWDNLGRRAGHVRNGLLVAQMPDMLIAFPYVGGSPGTWDAVTQAREAGITTHIYRVHHLCPLIERKLHR